MRRIFAFTTLFVLVLSALLGCNASDPSGNSKFEPPEATLVSAILPTTEEIQIAKPKPKDFNIKLSFVGDVMLASFKNQTKAGSFNEYVNNNEPEYFLEKVRHIFEADDFTIVNLENVLTDRKLTPKVKNHSPAYWYYSKTDNIGILTSSSVEGASLANNHINDYGNQGRVDTVNAVMNAGLQCGENDRLMLFEKNGFTIAVICHGLWGSYQTSAITKMLKKAEAISDFQIVFYHGGTQKVHFPEDWRKKASRQLVDAGADLVLGNHPHVLQPIEVYKGVEILYSLGNFCYGGSTKPENRTIIYQLDLTVNYEDLTVTNSQSNIIPCYVYTGDRNNYQPAPIEDEEHIDKVFQFLCWESDKPL